MVDDAEQVRAELRVFKTDVNGQLGALRADIKDMTKALRDLIRLDGDIRRQNDALARIGRQVDDHETRLRVVEIEDGKHGTRIGMSERIIWAIATPAVSGVVGLVVYQIAQRGGA